MYVFEFADARIFIIEKLATVIFSPLKEITHSITDHLFTFKTKVCRVYYY